MKNKIKRLLAAALALVMTVSMMQPMALNAFADGGNPDGPVDPETQCGICGHMAMNHMGVHMANDRIDRCMGCEMDPEMGGDCQCRDKTWAECADGGLTEIPTTLNGLGVTWPEGTYLSRGQVCCPHRDDGILKGDVFYGWDGVWPVDQLTADTYRVCFKGCEVILSDPSAHTHNSDAYGQDTKYHWTKCTDDNDNNGSLVEHTWNKGVCTVCSYPCAHAMFTEGQCAYCDYVCDHNGEIYGVCKICQEDMGPDPFVDIKAALAGKTDAQVCVHFNANLDACGGIANVLNALNQLRDVEEVTEFYPGFWQIRDSSYAVLGTVDVSDTHSFYHGSCERCGFVCDHNGAASGTCEICNEYLSSPSEFLADMKGQLTGKTDADVCVFLEDMGSEDRENGTARGPAKVLAKLGTLDNVTDIESLWGDTWFFKASGNRYSLYMNQQHAYQDGSCWRCSYQCSHNGADTGRCEICKKDLDALTPLDTLLAAIGDNECVELNNNMAGEMIHGKAAVIDALRQVNGIDPDIWHSEGGRNWDFHDADWNDYTLSVYGEAHDFSYGDSCSVCHYERPSGGNEGGGEGGEGGDGIDHGEPVDNFAECPICGHWAMDHQVESGATVVGSNDRVAMCHGCMGSETDCACAGKTWAECASGSSAALDQLIEAIGDNECVRMSIGPELVSGKANVIAALKNISIIKDLYLDDMGWHFADNSWTLYTLEVRGKEHDFSTGSSCPRCGYQGSFGPETLNGFSVTWPDGIQYDAIEGMVVCQHRFAMYHDNSLFDADAKRMVPETELTAGTYTACRSGCQVTLTGGPTVSVTGVTLDKETVSMKVGESVTITATVEPENATDTFVDWISYDREVATVSYGVVTAVGPGTATIVAINYESGCMAFCEVTVEAPHEHDGITFDKEIPATGGTLTAGNYYLAEDVKLSADLTISGTVNLCLNGHVLKGTGSGSVITVNGGAVLNLYDCGAETSGTITGGNNSTKSGGGGGGVLVRGTFNMYGGTISGNNATNSSHGGGVNVKGTFNMNGGVIQNNYSNSQAGGVFVAPGGKFTMNDGTIANNTAGNGGAGVYLNGACSFIMNGGTISGNTSKGSQGGGGVRVENANCFTMNGGSIINNTTAYAGGGVRASAFTMNGGTISGNTSSRTGGGVAAEGGITLNGDATITGNYMGTVEQNLYLPDNRFITVNSALTGTVGVTTANAAGGVISSNAVAENIVAHITADNSALEVRTDADGKLIVAKPVYPVTGVTLDMKAASMKVSDTLTLTAVVAPDNADNKNVSWESNNTGVATVSNGVVTAVAPGTATITVTTEDGGFTASCVVTVVNGDAQFAAEVDAQIDAIGTVEFTDASKDKIDAARTAYDALTDAQKALVTKLDVLTAAEKAYADLKAESEAAAALAQAKMDAKAAVEAAADGHTSENVKAAIEDAKAAIDAAASIDEVNTAKTKGVAAVNNVKHSYKENGKYSWKNVGDNFAMYYEVACTVCGKVATWQADMDKDNSEGYVTYTATTADGTIYTKKVVETVTVTYNGEEMGFDYAEIVTLTADTEVDWYADDVLVATAAKKYAFAATKDVTIITKEATVAKPVVTISANDRVWDTSAGKYVFSFTTSWSVPEGYTFVKGGFIYRYGAANYGQIDRDTVFAKGTTVNSSLKAKYGTFDYTLRMSSSYATRDIFGIGFIVVKDKYGHQETIYSDNMAINHAIG